jgi:hypothetical protein
MTFDFYSLWLALFLKFTRWFEEIIITSSPRPPKLGGKWRKTKPWHGRAAFAPLAHCTAPAPTSVPGLQRVMVEGGHRGLHWVPPCSRRSYEALSPSTRHMGWHYPEGHCVLLGASEANPGAPPIQRSRQGHCQWETPCGKRARSGAGHTRCCSSPGILWLGGHLWTKPGFESMPLTFH